MTSASNLSIRALSGFRIVDSGESRTDLRKRTEIKYTFLYPDLAKLRRVLSTSCQAISHNRPVSEVYSLYFDDARLSACQANLDGIGDRKKLRLRWYDSNEAPSRFFLEIKWRRNRATGKHRFEIESDKPLHQLSLSEIHNRLVQTTPPTHVRDVVHFFDPIIVVQYKREHFVSPDASLRMTLDYDIQFFDQSGRQFIGMRFPAKLEGLVVVEGKTPIGREVELQSLLGPLTPRAHRCSKYVHGCRLLGRIRIGE